MTETIMWHKTIDGKKMSFKYNPKEKYSLWVDGTECHIKPDKWSNFTGLDAGFILNGKEARIVQVSKYEMDFVVDGKYLSTGQPYTGMPWWAWIFAIINLALLATGGAVGGGCGAIGVIFVLRQAKSPRSLANRIVNCASICILTWGLAFSLIFLFSALIF